jgi:hypothetical protein
MAAACVYVFEDENSVDASELYPITPSCSVFETNLKPHAFELVTAQKVSGCHTNVLPCSKFTNKVCRFCMYKAHPTQRHVNGS